MRVVFVGDIGLKNVQPLIYIINSLAYYKNESFIIYKTINDILQRLNIIQSDVANKDHSHEMSGFCDYYLLGSLHYKDKLM